jgi:hypothetical protein
MFHDYSSASFFMEPLGVETAWQFHGAAENVCIMLREIHRHDDTARLPNARYNLLPIQQGGTMAISMYAASVPVFKHLLGSLDEILNKAEAHAAAKKIDPSVLLQARLFPDMLPFTKQIQIATDFAKGAPARLAGVEVPAFEDNEQSFADLHARIAKTLAFIDTLKPEQIDGSEGREIVVFPGTPREMKFPGQAYLLHFALPNFYFHVTTAYALLRHNGLEIGKKDFVGKLL